MKFRKLKADEIELRVKILKANGCSLVPYKDARCDMNILDETVGPENWQRDHKEVKGNTYAGVGIFNENLHSWIWKWDCGEESNAAKGKGVSSDSFKRACVNWGIGRELYTCPFIWISRSQCNITQNKNGKYEMKDTFKIKTIKYKDNKISELEVINKDTKKIVFTFKNGQNNIPKSPPKEETQTKPTNVEMYEVVIQAVKTGVMTTEEVANSIKEYEKEKFKELTYTEARSIYNTAVLRLKNKKGV